MAPSDRPTPLKLAIERGMRAGGDLADELRQLGDYTLKSKADAEAVCQVLSQIATGDSTAGGSSAFHSLVGLFQKVEDTECPAFSIMQEQGTPLLTAIVNRALQDSTGHKPDDVLLALKVLASYGTSEGTTAVLRAARLPLEPDSYLWKLILSSYGNGHPERERVFQQLSDPLPPGFLAVFLLEAANSAHLEGALDRHPFDSRAGVQQIERWLMDRDEENFFYAFSAATALPFLTSPELDALLALALDHPSAGVQMEAAWAAARLGREAGVKWLARSCLDVNLSARAKTYLNELGHAAAIPAESEDATFRAKAEFANWLAHPNELGRPPDDLEIVDHRQLAWPPERNRIPLWLIKYRIRNQTEQDDVDVGLVGSTTFCLFSYKLAERPPEDGYAIHCYWEMTCRGLITEMDVPTESHEYEGMLRQQTLDGIADPRIFAVAEFSPELKYPQPLVGLARATRHGKSGWLVLDGPRSRWYAAAEMPADVWEKTVVAVHAGRVLLGFREEPDRRRYLEAAGSDGPPLVDGAH